MICLSVHKNGAFVCNAGMADLSMLTAHIHGSRYAAAAASVDVTGIQDLPDKGSAHVSWVRDMLLKPGDSLIFVLINNDDPDAPLEITPTGTPAYLQEQREYEALLQGHTGPEPLAEHLHTSLAFKLSLGDEEIMAQLPDDHAHMLCTLMWESWRTDRCRVSARSFAGAASGAVENKIEWLEGELELGDSFEITVLA